jgi:benzoate-CoA ligase family protein
MHDRAADVILPAVFNAATYFIDRHIEERRGDKVAIECGGQRVTYAQLAGRVNQAGNALRDRLDVRQEERVLLLLHDTPEFIYSFFGAIKIGAVPVPISTTWKPDDYEYVLNDSRARVAIVSAPLLPALQATSPEHRRHLRHTVVVGPASASPCVPWPELVDGASPALEAEHTSCDDAAFWLYSSGSTGSPKGCVHLQHDMVVCTELYARRTLGLTESDRTFSVAKLFFAYGLGNAMYFPLGVGATTILWPGSPTAANVYAVIEQHRPTLLFSVPTNYAMLLAHRQDGREFDLSSVRYGVSAGEALPPALFERFRHRFGVEILDGIGSTEVLHIFISNRPGDIRPGSSGQIVPGYEARLVDDQQRPVAAGEIGNLLIKGDSTCAYYWNKHRKTVETIEGSWIRTGDKYSQDPDGYFWYAGRSDDMMKVGGQWVSPVDVENALVEHPAVLECGVGSRTDRDGLIKPFAFVVLHEGTAGSPELEQELLHFVRTRIAEYKRPRWLVFVSGLPKTSTGKIQRFKLREMASQLEPEPPTANSRPSC